MSHWLTNLINKSVFFRSAFIVIAWLFVWQLGRVVEYTEHASVWFPAAGFTFSCLLVLGKRAFIPLLIAAIVITFWSGNHYKLPLTWYELLWAGLLFGIAHISPYWIGAKCIRHLNQQAKYSVPKLIVTFLVVAGASALFATLFVISSLVMTNQMAMQDVNKTILPFWIGDTAGIVVLAPLFTSVIIRLFPDPKFDLSEFTQEGLGSYKSLIMKMGLNIFLIILCMLLAYFTGTQESSFAIFFLAITHMWIATTESPIFNTLSLVVSSLLIVLLVHLLNLMEYVMIYQFAINVIAANALFGVAIPQLKAYNRELEDMVYTDTLTQVSSRQYLIQRSKIEIEKSHQQQSDLTLVVFDLDNFKSINDNYGHSQGDFVLKKICKTIEAIIRKNDLIARFGGDEFIILFPEKNINTSYKIVDEIRQSINQIKIGQTLISSSFGMAQLQAEEGFTALFNRADKALYLSKENGGNQITKS